jgi:hypothetical protein
MAHDVFLCHSTKNKTVVDAVCTSLEGHGIRCWVAPRDIPVGANYGESIIDGINASQVMVVVLSSHSNASPHVQREVERAVSKGVIIIPLRIEDIELSKSLEFFLSTSHWFDAFKLQQHNYLEILADRVGHLVSGSTDAPVEQPPRPTPQAPKADLVSEINGLLNGLNQQVDDQIQQQLDQAVTGVKQGMQGTSVEQPAAPVETAPPVFAADGAQAGTPSGSPPQGRSLVHTHEKLSFIHPSEPEIRQSSQYVFNSVFIQTNDQYRDRINAVTFVVDLEDPTVNAFARDDKVGEETDGTPKTKPYIRVLGGIARTYRLIAAGLALHIQLTDQGGSPSHLPRLFQHLGDEIIANNGTFPDYVGEDLYSKCLGAEIETAFESGNELFFSLSRSLCTAMEMSVIAHEAGHIALGHTRGKTLNYDMSRNQEREADSFAASCLSTSPFRDYLFLGQVFSDIIFCWVDHAIASDEVSTHPASRERFDNTFRSMKETAEDAAEKYGLTKEVIEGFLPPTGEA